MGGAANRRKGMNGELQVFKLIGEGLGRKIDRNLTQTRDGGYDTMVGKWCVEVKRQETLKVRQWWAQTVHTASQYGVYPMLIFRQNRSPWRVFVRAIDYVQTYGTFHFGCSTPKDAIIEIDLAGAIDLLKHYPV